jgi:hypothetical protein
MKNSLAPVSHASRRGSAGDPTSSGMPRVSFTGVPEPSSLGLDVAG